MLGWNNSLHQKDQQQQQQEPPISTLFAKSENDQNLSADNNDDDYWIGDIISPNATEHPTDESPLLAVNGSNNNFSNGPYQEGSDSSRAPKSNQLSTQCITADPLPNNNNDDNKNNSIINDCFQLFWVQPVSVLNQFLTKMGGCLSAGGGAPLVENSDGTEEEFYNRYIEDRELGEGEFGVVKLVHDMKDKARGDSADDALACKYLRKGVVFKDNTIYSPIKPEVLKAEVNMLRTLAGKHFCLELRGVYESSKLIFIVTEFCGGGEMMEYVSAQEEDLRTEDVSRISFQLLDAVNHCSKHNIIHRDIKPENVMFQTPSPGSDLRLIDFGSGTDRVVEENHTTFAGSAFYTSPEMFQRTYTDKTDVWSVGVTLYVLVAGYPADVLQKAFNILQRANRDLKELPNLPDNMPDSYYDMLEGLLVYRHKKRKAAGDVLDHEFVQFFNDALSLEQIALQAQVGGDKVSDLNDMNNNDSRKRRTQSISLVGSVSRHTVFLGYQKFERSLTTLMATLLDKNELDELIRIINEKTQAKESGYEAEVEQTVTKISDTKLDVIPINELKEILEDKHHDQVLTMISKIPESERYNNFAYHIELLKEFAGGHDARRSKRSVRGRRGSESFRSKNNSLRGSFRGGLFFRKGGADLDSSIHSAGSLRGFNSSNPVNSSVHGGGGGVYKDWQSGTLINPRNGQGKGKSKIGRSQSEAVLQKNNYSR